MNLGRGFGHKRLVHYIQLGVAAGRTVLITILRSLPDCMIKSAMLD